MFEALGDRLAAALKTITGRGVLRPEDVEAGLREVRLALLEADVNFKVVKEFVDRVRTRLVGVEVAPGLTAPQQVVKAVNIELVELLGANSEGLRYSPAPPTVLMLAGLQGSGKTTTAVKLARLARREGHKPMLVALDLRRPAAVEQLRILAGKESIAFHSGEGAVDAIASAALKEASRLGLDGVILTKLDGDARGGAALSLRLATGQRIRFAGTGERPEDLEVFHAERMASRILGMGDVLSLIERAEQTIDQEAAKEVESHLRSGHLTFNDFLVQVRQLRSLGSVEGILEMVPGGAKLKGQVAGADTEREVRRMEAVILSMTARERTHPEIIDGARRRRIARGSGLQPADVNRVLTAREAMQQVAKQFGLGNRGSKAGASRLFGQGGSGWSR